MNHVVPVRNRIGLVISGLGTQGQRLLNHLDAINVALSPDWQVEVTHYIEPNEENCESARRQAPKYFESGARRTEYLREALTRMIEEGYHKRFAGCVVYDASPSENHLANLALVHSMLETNVRHGLITAEYLHYFGEKPLITLSEEQLSQFDALLLTALCNTPHYCHFTELFNPTVVALHREITERNLQITKLRFWRSSTIAIEQYVTQCRAGVTGGAFMDKTIHDISIASSLINLHTTHRSTAPRFMVHVAEPRHYLPFRLSCHDAALNIARSLSGKEHAPGSSLPPAEGATYVRLTLGTACDTEFYGSWLGLDTTATSDLAALCKHFQLRHLPVAWTHDHKPRDFMPGIRKEEARIIYASTIDEGGANREYLGNLLTRDASRPGEPLHLPWLCRKDADDYDLLSIVHQDAIESGFTEVFRNVANQLTTENGKRQLSPLGTEMSAAVHSIAHEMRQRLNASYDRSVHKDALITTRALAMQRVIAPHAFIVRNH